jgi:hypothetical protein
MVVFFVLALITGNMADNSVGWLDWIACAVLSLACTAYCVFYMLRVFKVRLSL